MASLLQSDALDLALDPVTGDFAVDANGSPYMIAGLDGIAQLCRIAILLRRGEWFLDLDAGVPWSPNDTVSEAAAILGSKYNETYVRGQIRAAITSVPGVLAVTTLEISFDAAERALSITWAASTVFGDTEPDILPAPVT